MWRSVTRRLHIPPRNPNFARLTAEDLAYFRSFLPAAAVQTSDLDVYNTDWLKLAKGASPVVLKPAATTEVQQILRYCNDRRLAVCPQGGRTGLVLGGVAIHDEITLSMGRMNRVLELDAQQGIVRCEAGVVLEALSAHVNQHGFIVPLDLGAKGSCQLGGNLSTNAGGIRYLRYGSLRGNVLGLEAVLADGSVVDSMSSMRKDNTGYDLKQLFIGSEGTLGVITKVSLLLPAKPNSVQIAFFSCDSFPAIVKLFHLARSHLCEVMSAFEFMDEETMAVVLKHTPKATVPVKKRNRFYALVEVSGSDSKHDKEKLEKFSEVSMSEIENLDGIIADESAQMEKIWKLRESANPACVKEGFVSSTQNLFKYDISLPLTHFYELVKICREKVGELGMTVGYGHIGDSNLHLNVVVWDLGVEERVRAVLEPFIYEYVRNVNGSISAEHGIGLYKRDKLSYARSPTQVKYMVHSTQRLLKQQLDPHSILNPYKVLPD